jgi:hypothetical protein
VAPGAAVLTTVKVKVKSTAPEGSWVARLVTIRSSAEASKKDAVKLTAKRG